HDDRARRGGRRARRAPALRHDQGGHQGHQGRARGVTMSKKLPLTLAISHYDHITELVTGRVQVEGVDLTCLNLTIEDIFFRMVNYKDFDVSEFSMGKHSSLTSQGDAPFVAIPVFPSRVTRHSSI